MHWPHQAGTRCAIRSSSRDGAAPRAMAQCGRGAAELPGERPAVTRAISHPCRRPDGRHRGTWIAGAETPRGPIARINHHCCTRPNIGKSPLGSRVKPGARSSGWAEMDRAPIVSRLASLVRPFTPLCGEVWCRQGLPATTSAEILRPAQRPSAVDDREMKRRALVEPVTGRTPDRPQ